MLPRTDSSEADAANQAPRSDEEVRQDQERLDRAIEQDEARVERAGREREANQKDFGQQDGACTGDVNSCTPAEREAQGAPAPNRGIPEEQQTTQDFGRQDDG